MSSHNFSLPAALITEGVPTARGSGRTHKGSGKACLELKLESRPLKKIKGPFYFTTT